MSEQPQAEGWWQAADGRWYPPRLSAPAINPLALASLVCSLVGLAVVNFPLGPVLAIVAVVLGHVGLRQIRRAPERHRGRGMAVAGIVIGYVGIVGAILFWAWFLWWAD